MNWRGFWLLLISNCLVMSMIREVIWGEDGWVLMVIILCWIFWKGRFCEMNKLVKV